MPLFPITLMSPNILAACYSAAVACAILQKCSFWEGEILNLPDSF